jgi:hypothetical protein
MTTENNFVDPTDPGRDVDVLREHIKHLERQVRHLTAQVQPVSPSREDLIRSLAVLALTNIELGNIDSMAIARINQMPASIRAIEGYTKEIQRVKRCIKNHHPVSSDDTQIVATLENVRQLSKVTQEELEAVIQFTQE